MFEKIGKLSLGDPPMPKLESVFDQYLNSSGIELKLSFDTFE